MGSKLILLLSLLIGVFLTFMCVNENKTTLSAKYNQIANAQQTVIPTKISPKARKLSDDIKTKDKKAIELSESSFLYSIKDSIRLNAKFSEKDKNPNIQNFISNYCPKESCQKNISYEKNIKRSPWQNDIIKIATFFKDNDVKNGLISIKGKLLNIEGELKSKEDMTKLNELLTPFSPEVYKMENLTKILQEPKKSIPSKQELQAQIATLLITNPIYFEKSSAIIKNHGKKILDKIIEKLKKYDKINLRVEGHTDAIGKNSYNRWLSQKRAESVKKYLLKNLKNATIKAVGYGESKPISKNPRDKINRRVEIYIQGEK